MMEAEKIIKLFSNGGAEDKQAFALLTEAKIPFVHYGPTSEEPTPTLEVDQWKYYGLDAIKNFIRAFSEQQC